ncbi:hypothetical protein [Streptomyces sp. NPDC058145]|uniref:hypothetical protein n=1 Tax=Streptomyces sp. NPDC058145 TaxID=3346356 RepID=UPI0036E445E6
MAPLTEYLEPAELVERALSDAGRVEVRSESVGVEFAVPGAEIFLDEFDPVLRIFTPVPHRDLPGRQSSP